MLKLGRSAFEVVICEVAVVVVRVVAEVVGGSVFIVVVIDGALS